VARHLSYAIRVLRKSPVFTLTTIATIALGVGASTAVFSVVHAVLLQPLPYEDPDRLVFAYGEMRRRDVTDLPLSGADLFDLRSRAQAGFEGFAGVQTGRTLILEEDGRPAQARFASVTPNLFRLLGGRIVLGRDFMDAEAEPEPPEKAGLSNVPPLLRPSTVAILSYGYWQRRYGGRTDIVGRGLDRGNSGARVVGVLAPGFELLFPPRLNVERSPDVWFAARLNHDNAERKLFSHRVIGRLKTGVRLETARAEVDGVAAGLRRQFALWQTADFHIRLQPVGPYLVAPVAPAILALMGAATFLLLIAWANVANLLLVRASLRERELATRVALGASRWQLVWQMLAEACVLAAMGTMAGLALAWLGVKALLGVAPASVPRIDAIGMKPGVLAFAVVLGMGGAVLFGVAPAWRASRRDVMEVLRAGGRAPGLRGAGVVRSGVVVVEVALSFVLLIGSGLMLRSFVTLQAIDVGLDPHGLLTFQLLGPDQADTHQREARVRAVEDRLKAIPGVQGVTASRPFPLADTGSPIRWGTEEALVDASAFQAVDHQRVLPGYFETLRTPLIAGRTFMDGDNTGTRAVAVIDQLLAAKAFPHESAIGKRLLVRIRTTEPEWVEVIGVVAHQRASSLTELGREQIYFTDGFLGHGGVARWAIRTAGDSTRYAGAVREAIAAMDRQFLITEMQPMDALLQRAQASTRFPLLLIGLFAGIAAVLATVGIYGVLSTVVRQRTAEIGIRMALGATPASILGLVVGHGLKLSASGMVAGFVAAIGLTRMMRSMLIGVEATDLRTFVAVTLLFLVIAAIACWLPARRAAAIDPTAALGEE
jgi:putative ABC transport system permease protein